MTEEYASMKQIEFMKKLGFPPQSADRTKQEARQMIQEKLEERDKGNGKVDAPVERHDEIREMVTKAADRVVEAKAKEYHLSPEEVKCRALESAIAVGAGDRVLETADKFVEWIYGVSK